MLFCLATSSFAASLSPYAFPFVGKWNPSENPILLDDYGLQDIQNLRKQGKHFKGVSGHDNINTTALTTYPYILNGYHFRKDQPQESHVLVMAGEYFNAGGVNLADGSVIADGSERAGSFLTMLYQNKTVIPGAGDFEGTALYTPIFFDELWQFSSAPSGNVIISSGQECLIWGGDEIEATAVFTSSAAVTYTLTNGQDFSDVLANTSQDSDQTASLTAAGSGTIIIGSKRPLQGVKFYIKTANGSASTLTGKEWTGAEWTALTLTDNTAVGGKTLYQTGTVTWDYTGNAKPRYLNGFSLYWYQFNFDAGSTTLYYVTTDAPVQKIRNIWDGIEYYPAKVLLWNDTTYKDYTDDAADDSLATYADLSSATSSYALYVGFLEPQQALTFAFNPGYENTNAATMTVKYWNGSAWTAVGSSNDGTLDSGGTKTLSKGGVVTWQSPGYGVDTKRAISDEFPLYYYQITVNNTLDASVQVGEITGAAYPPEIPPYKFSKTFQNRAFLFNELNGKRNKAIYSAENSPDIWNGTDSGEIILGDRTAITAAAVIYNVFTDTATEQLLIAKKNETWRLSGDTVDNWNLKKISSNIGCVAPLTMVSADVAETDPNQRKTVAIWVSDRGPVMSAGSTIVPIYEDIKCYWDENDSRYIPSAMQPRSVAWYDTKTRSYKLLIASGSTAEYLNTELEYSLVTKEWTKIYREDDSGANPLQSGWPVFDENGVGYTYGGGKDGYLYRLEYGNTWNGTPIASYLHTKDLILDTERPMFRKSAVKYLRLMHKAKATGDIAISHYGDGVLSVTGVNGQFAPQTITNEDTTTYNTQSVNLGNFLYHSFKFSASTSVDDGLELLGFGIYYVPDDTLR